MKSTLPGAMRPDSSALPLMPMAANGDCARIAPSLSTSLILRKRNSDTGTVGSALQDRVVDLHTHVGQLAVDRRLDGRNQTVQRDRPAAEPPIAEHDGDEADHENAGENFAAHMGAARGQFPELDLDRLQAPAAPAPDPAPATPKSPCDLRWSA